MKIKYSNLLCLLILFFSPLFSAFCLLSTNGRQTVSVIYAACIVLVSIKADPGILQKGFVYLCLFSAVKLICALMKYPDAIVEEIQMLVFFFLLYCFASHKNMYAFAEFCKQRENLVQAVCICYLILQMVSFVWGSGINYKGWGTITLNGTHGLAHIYSYELLIFCVLSVEMLDYTSHIRWLVFTAIFVILQFLTAVRTTILVLAIAIVYFLIYKQIKNKRVYILIGIAVGLLLVFRFGILDAVLQKTENQIGQGSAISHRDVIFESSMDLFRKGSFFDKLNGVGVNRLKQWNLQKIRLAIQAHNDFITTLVSSGVLSLAVYIVLLLRFCRKSNMLFLLLSIGSLIWFNGLYTYYPFSIGLMTWKLFFKEKNNRKTKQIRLVTKPSQRE